MTEGNKNRPVKLTITFGDGHAEDFDTFIAAIAQGLIPAGKANGVILYSAPEEGPDCATFSMISADPAVVAGILMSMDSLADRIIESMDAGTAIAVSNAMANLNPKHIERFKDTAIITRRLSEN